MDDGGGLGPLNIRNWVGYNEPPLKNNLGLQLMSSAMDQDRRPLLLNNTNFPIDFIRDGWFSNRDTNIDSTKFLHAFPPNPSYAFNASPSHNFQMHQQPNLLPKNDLALTVDEPKDKKELPLKKRSSQGQVHKSLKLKKPKKVAASKVEVSQRKVANRSEELVINGIDLDLSKLPTPVCSCTGKPHQCYRWGVGGWQSACCTKNVSIYPLPLSMKRRGARIAGRKMSLGAFKKVLEQLAGEGYNLSNPIDLRPFWAKHGTNKFVTIR